MVLTSCDLVSTKGAKVEKETKEGPSREMDRRSFIKQRDENQTEEDVT